MLGTRRLTSLVGSQILEKPLSSFKGHSNYFYFYQYAPSITILICVYYINTSEILGFFLLLKNHIFITRSEDTIFIVHTVKISFLFDNISFWPFNYT